MGFLKNCQTGTKLRVKVVPAASRDRIVGVLGDRLKIQVAAAPERGKANAAVLALLSKSIGVSLKRLSVTAGLSSPQKTIHIDGLSADAARAALGLT